MGGSDGGSQNRAILTLKQDNWQICLLFFGQNCTGHTVAGKPHVLKVQFLRGIFNFYMLASRCSGTGADALLHAERSFLFCGDGLGRAL